MGLILVSDLFTSFILFASTHAFQHLRQRVPPARFLHVSESRDPRFHVASRSWTVSYWFDYSWTIYGTSVKRFEVRYCSLHSFIQFRLFHDREGKESMFYLAVSFADIQWVNLFWISFLGSVLFADATIWDSTGRQMLLFTDEIWQDWDSQIENCYGKL